MTIVHLPSLFTELFSMCGVTYGPRDIRFEHGDDPPNCHACAWQLCRLEEGHARAGDPASVRTLTARWRYHLPEHEL